MMMMTMKDNVIYYDTTDGKNYHDFFPGMGNKILYILKYTESNSENSGGGTRHRRSKRKNSNSQKRRKHTKKT
jgi:hypothetical protein